MSLVNYATREITCKIVYYGPGRSGKTTNLHYIYGQVPGDRMLLLLSVFDRESSLGIVQLYLDELRATLVASAPAHEDAPPALAEHFERDLNTNLAALFGKR